MNLYTKVIIVYVVIANVDIRLRVNRVNKEIQLNNIDF
jgi:hypothetical protein